MSHFLNSRRVSYSEGCREHLHHYFTYTFKTRYQFKKLRIVFNSNPFKRYWFKSCLRWYLLKCRALVSLKFKPFLDFVHHFIMLEVLSTKSRIHFVMPIFFSMLCCKATLYYFSLHKQIQMFSR